MRKYFIITIIILICIAGCTNSDVFFKYKKIRSSGWDKDSTLVFDFVIADTSLTYNVYVNIRNTSEYPYQNFWFFIKKSTAKRGNTFAVFATDTIECYLADGRGKWLGNGIGAAYEMPLLIEQGAVFDSNTCRYEIVQGMRCDILRGISDIGLRVEKIE
ncbi:MAG: gliding motility lipoprotein GldH [Prevotellaceae bacterium]|jgi:gliding motility-associated lipoprotein GldH|nr:gliding motility lipoprotein GldH [Prevotellaceae bacterium]